MAYISRRTAGTIPLFFGSKKTLTKKQSRVGKKIYRVIPKKTKKKKKRKTTAKKTRKVLKKKRRKGCKRRGRSKYNTTVMNRCKNKTLNTFLKKKRIVGMKKFTWKV